MMTRSALKNHPNARLYELPEYELANTVLLRFPPWRKGTVHAIQLTPTELAAKRRMMGSYPSQGDGIRMIRLAITAAGVLSALRGRPFSFDDFGAVEHFGAVPRDRDYTKSPHGLDLLDYVGDDCDGQSISYTRMIAPLAQVIL